MPSLRHVALGAIVCLAGCGQDPSGPTLSPANAKTSSLILIGAVGFDGIGQTVTFQTAGKKLSDFSMVIEDQIVRDPRVTTFDHLGAGDYTITATPPAGLVVSQIVCNVSPGSSADVSAPPTVTIHLAKKGSARCTFVMAATT